MLNEKNIYSKIKLFTNQNIKITIKKKNKKIKYIYN